MTTRPRTIAGLFLLSLAFSVVPTNVRAQMAMSGSGAGRSLGGYGASAIGSYYSSGNTGYLPYNGNGSGFIASRPGLGLGASAAPVSRRVLDTTVGGMMMTTTPIGGSSLPGSMGSASRSSMGMRTTSQPRSFIPYGYEGGLGMGSGMGAAPMSSSRRSPTGPGFSYPFRMPAGLGGSGSMTMP